MKKIILLILFTFILNITHSQVSTKTFFDKFDYEIGQFIGYEYNNIKSEIGEPWHSVILDTTTMVRTHYYRLINEKDTIQYQIHYDKDLVCNRKTFILDKNDYPNKLNNIFKKYMTINNGYITPNRYLINIEIIDNEQFLLGLYPTIYPIILSQLDQIQNHLLKASKEYSNYDLTLALSMIKKLNRSILVASTLNNITQKELNILKTISNSYQDLVNYNGVKISFIQYNRKLYFELIQEEIDSLKHKSFDEINFSELKNITQF